MVLKPLCRPIAFILSVIFMLAETAQYAPQAHAAPAMPASVELNVEHFTLPRKMGRVIESHQGSSGQTVILIQDAHTVYVAQQSMAALIQNLNAHYGIDVVALEGGAGAVDPVLLRNAPSRRARNQLLKEYLRKGEMSGAIAAAMKSAQPLQVYGIENQALYERDLRSFLQAKARASGLLEKNRQAVEALERLKKEFYPPEFLKIDGLISKFEKNPQDFQVLLPFLKSSHLSVRYPNLSLLAIQMKSAGPLRMAQIETLAAQLKRLPLKKNEAMALEEKVQAYRTSRLDAAAFAGFLLARANAYSLDLEPFAELSVWARGYKKLFTANGAEIDRELKRLFKTLRQHYLRTQNLREISRQDDFLKLYERFLKLELTRSEWKKILRIKKDFQQLSDPELRNHFIFYETALEREKIFLSGIKTLLRRQKRHALIFVAGGFHLEGMAKLLSQEGISYLSVQPRIRGLPEENVYERIMRGDVSWKKYFQVREGKVSLYEAFHRAALEKILAQAPEAEQPFVFRAWRDNILRDLSQHSKITSDDRYVRLLQEAFEQVHAPRIAKQRKIWQAKAAHFFDSVERLILKNRISGDAFVTLFQSAAMPAADVALAIPSYRMNAELLGIPQRRSEMRSATPAQAVSEEMLDELYADLFKMIAWLPSLRLNAAAKADNPDIKDFKTKVRELQEDLLAGRSTRNGLAAGLRDADLFSRRGQIDFLAAAAVWLQNEKRPAAAWDLLADELKQAFISYAANSSNEKIAGQAAAAAFEKAFGEKKHALQQPLLDYFKVYKRRWHERVAEWIHPRIDEGPVRIVWANGLYHFLNLSLFHLLVMPALWGLIGLMIGGTTLAILLGGIVFFAVQKPYQGLLYALRDYAQRGRQAYSFKNASEASPVKLKRNASWGQIAAQYNRLLAGSMSRPDLEPPVLRLHLLEILLRPLEGHKNFRTLLAKIKARLIKVPAATPEMLQRIANEEVLRSPLGWRDPAVLFLESILGVRFAAPQDSLKKLWRERNYKKIGAEVIRLAYQFVQGFLYGLTTIFFFIARRFLNFFGLYFLSGYLERIEFFLDFALGRNPAIRLRQSIVPKGRPVMDSGAQTMTVQEQAGRQEILNYLRGLDVPELNALLPAVQKDIVFRFQAFFDPVWFPSMLRYLVPEHKKIPEDHHAWYPQRKLLVLSRTNPVFLNALLVIKFLPFAFQHQVILATEKNIHIPDQQFFKIQRKVLWAMAKDLFRKRHEAKAAPQHNALFAHFLLALVPMLVMPVESGTAQPGRLEVSRRSFVTGSMLKAAESTRVAFFQLQGLLIPGLVPLTAQPPLTGNEMRKKGWAGSLFKLLRPLLKNVSMSIFTVTLMAGLFSGIIFHLDMSFLDGIFLSFKDFLASIDFLNIGPWIKAGWEKTIQIFIGLKIFFRDYLALDQIKAFLIWLGSWFAWVKPFFAVYITPFLYKIALPAYYFLAAGILGYAAHHLHMGLRRLMKANALGLFLRKTVYWSDVLYGAAALGSAYLLSYGVVDFGKPGINNFQNIIRSAQARGLPLTGFELASIMAMLGAPFFSMIFLLGVGLKKIHERWEKFPGFKLRFALFISLAMGFITFPTLYEWVFVSNPTGSVYVREEMKQASVNLRDSRLDIQGHLEAKVLAAQTNGTQIQSFADLMKQFKQTGVGSLDAVMASLTEAKFLPQFTGMENLIRPYSGRAVLTDENDNFLTHTEDGKIKRGGTPEQNLAWLGRHKAEMIQALRDNKPAMRGNSEFFDDFFQLMQMNAQAADRNTTAFYRAFTSEEWELVLEHLFEIASGRIAYPNFGEQYFHQTKAVWSLNSFLKGGTRFELVESFSLENGKSIKGSRTMSRIPDELSAVWIRTMEKFLAARSTEKDIQYYLELGRDAGFTDLIDLVRERGFEPLRQAAEKKKSEEKSGAAKKQARSELRKTDRVLKPILQALILDRQPPQRAVNAFERVFENTADTQERLQLLHDFRISARRWIARADFMSAAYAAESRSLDLTPAVQTAVRRFVQSGALYAYLARQSGFRPKSLESLLELRRPAALVLHESLLPQSPDAAKNFTGFAVEILKQGFLILPRDASDARLRLAAARTLNSITDPLLKARIRRLPYVPDFHQRVSYSLLKGKMPPSVEKNPRLILWNQTEAPLQIPVLENEDVVAVTLDAKVLRLLTLQEVISILWLLSLAPVKVRRSLEEQLGLKRNGGTNLLQGGRDFLQNLARLAQASASYASAA